MPVYPRLNYPINHSSSSRSTANCSHESEAPSVPRLRGRRSMQQGLGNSTAAEQKDLDGINSRLDDMATRDQDPRRTSPELSRHLRDQIHDVIHSTTRINTPTRDAAFHRAEDARIAAAWKSGREATPADTEPLISLSFTTPSKQGQPTTSGNRQQQQLDIFSDPNVMASFDTAAIAHSDQELERMKHDLAVAKAEQAEAEQQQQSHAINASNISTKKPHTPVSNGTADQQTRLPSDGTKQHVQTPISNEIKKEQQTPLPNGTKQPQQQTPMSNGNQQKASISNGGPHPATPLSLDTPKHVANTAATVEASTKLKQLAKDVEAAGWEMQTMKQDLGEVRGELGGVKREMSGMRGDVSGVKKDVKAVNVDIVRLKSEVVCLREFLETMSGQVGMLARNLESTSGQMTGLGKGVQDMKHDMDGLKEQATNLASGLKTLSDLATRAKDILAATAKTPIATAALPNATTTITPLKKPRTDPFNSSTPRAPGTFPITPASSSTKTHANVNPRHAPAHAPDSRDSTTWFWMAFRTFWCCVILHDFLKWCGYEGGLLDRGIQRDIVEVIERFCDFFGGDGFERVGKDG